MSNRRPIINAWWTTNSLWAGIGILKAMQSYIFKVDPTDIAMATINLNPMVFLSIVVLMIGADSNDLVTDSEGIHQTLQRRLHYGVAMLLG